MTAKQILIVEDEKPIRDMIAFGLKRAGYEVVQLYVRDLVCSVTRPPRELKGFARVHLERGEQRTVELPIGYDQLAFYDRAMEETVEPGEFELMVGPDSVTLQAAQLAVE